MLLEEGGAEIIPEQFCFTRHFAKCSGIEKKMVTV